MAAAHGLRIVRWWWMLRALEPGLPPSACVRPYLASMAVNNVLPRPSPFDRFVPMQYAAASSRFPWAVAPMIGYALRDLAPEHAGLPVTHSAFDDPSPPPQGSLVVDIGKGIAASP